MTTDLTGRTLNHYRVVRRLGAGGMGEVYEAEDLKLGRRVALKILPAETAADPQRRERFEREAKAVAALNHPNIVTIFSVEQADGIDFITLELLEGKSLREALPPHGLPLGALLDVAIPLCEAVAAAHQHGITHRDLKPENVLVRNDGKVKVLDFGLAKIGEGAIAGGALSVLPTMALTAEGRIVGTVAYMSPEQAEGKRVDPRSDVFTLGIILYEMATGERPFKGETTVSLLSSILKDHPKPVTEVNARLPRDLARIIERCLAKDPARRFQSALGLATELETLRQDSTPGARSVSWTSIPGEDADARRRRNTRNAIVGGTLIWFVAAAGFLGWKWWHRETSTATSTASSASTVHRIVVLPFENLGAAEDAYFAAGMTEEIASRLGAVGGLGVISRASAAQYASSAKTTKQIGAELGVDYVLDGTVRWDKEAGRSRVRVTPHLVRVSDETQVWGDRFDREMKDVFAVQSEIAEQVVARLGLAVGAPPGANDAVPPTKNMEAYRLYLQGRMSDITGHSTRDTAFRSIELLEQAVRLDPSFAVAWATLSRLHTSAYHWRYDFDESRLGKARECADKALAIDPDLHEGHLALGYYYYQGMRDYAQAVREFQLAARGRDNDPDVIEATAYVLRRQGRWDEALAGLQKAYSLNPRSYDVASALSQVCAALRRYPEALRYSDEGMALLPGVPGPLLERALLLTDVDGDTRRSRATLAEIDPRAFPELPGLLSLMDEYDGLVDQAIQHAKEFPSDVLDTQTFYQPKPLILGLIELNGHGREAAAPACAEAAKVLDQVVVSRPRDARVRAALGLALACLGRKEDALREARLAADLVPITSDALDGPEFQESLAMVEAIVGEHGASLDRLEKLLVMPAGIPVNRLRLDPIWKPLRDEPRYKALVEKDRPAA